MTDFRRIVSLGTIARHEGRPGSPVCADRCVAPELWRETSPSPSGPSADEPRHAADLADIARRLSVEWVGFRAIPGQR
jgi:hypothetical protein